MKQAKRIPRNRFSAGSTPFTHFLDMLPPVTRAISRKELDTFYSRQEGGESPGIAGVGAQSSGDNPPSNEGCFCTTRRQTRVLFLCLILLSSACGVSQKLSHDKAREKIQQLGVIELGDKDVEVKQIIQSGDDQAVAEANLKMTFRLSKTKGGDWQVNALRLGDRNWMDIKSLVSALDEVRIRETRENLTKLVNAMNKLKEKNGQYPQARNIIELTDLLVPNFMSEVIRYDAWNRELVFRSVSPDSFELISLGPDGIRGTGDDIVFRP
jgi:type II secretion system (T2SS) protein G